MRAKVKITVTTRETREIEADFPIYRKHDVSPDRGFSVYYSRIEADGTKYIIDKSRYSSRDDFSFSISIKRIALEGDEDYLLGKGEYACTAAEFSAVLNEAELFFARFRTGSASNTGESQCAKPS